MEALLLDAPCLPAPASMLTHHACQLQHHTLTGEWPAEECCYTSCACPTACAMFVLVENADPPLLDAGSPAGAAGAAEARARAAGGRAAPRQVLPVGPGHPGRRVQQHRAGASPARRAARGGRDGVRLLAVRGLQTAPPRSAAAPAHSVCPSVGAGCGASSRARRSTRPARQRLPFGCQIWQARLARAMQRMTARTAPMYVYKGSAVHFFPCVHRSGRPEPEACS